MRIFQVRVELMPEGGYVAICRDPELSAQGASRKEALERLRGEIRYWIEPCPCGSVGDEYVKLQLA